LSFGANWHEVFARIAERPPPITYGVAFTPRAGSTYLSDIVRQSRALGSPGEYFNINAAFDSISRAACTRFEDYYDWLTRVRQTNGVFGFEISGPWLERLELDGHLAVLDRVDRWFFLRRRDYVLQAVSLYLAASSGVFHQREGEGEPAPEDSATEDFVAGSDAAYDAEAIAEAILQLMNGEVQFTRYFRAGGIEAAPLWYEDMVDAPPGDFLCSFAGCIGVTLQDDQLEQVAAVEPRLRRGGGERNADYAQRFRKERPEFIAHWDDFRGRMGAAAWRASAEAQEK
jgi:LPS sulfotransferase NodH